MVEHRKISGQKVRTVLKSGINKYTGCSKPTESGGGYPMPVPTGLKKKKTALPYLHKEGENDPKEKSFLSYANV